MTEYHKRSFVRDRSILSLFMEQSSTSNSPYLSDSSGNLGCTSSDTNAKYSDGGDSRKFDASSVKLSVPSRDSGIRQSSKDSDSDHSEIALSKDVLTEADVYSEPDKAQELDYWTYVPKRSSQGRGDSPTTSDNEPHAFLKEYCLTRQPHLLKHSDTVVHQVQFKCCYRYFTTGAHGPSFFNVNEFVIVKGERGEDMGIVVALFSNRIYLEKLQEEGYSGEDDEFKLRRILRLATKFERNELANKEIDEMHVAQYCADVATHVYQLPMKILTAEYQFDRNKLIIYYAATVHVDFRELVKNIFATFKTSVWLKKVERGHAFVGRPHAVLGLKTGLIYGR